MDVFQAIETRYSHKEKFLPHPVSKEHLEKIAFAGLTTPSGANAQSVYAILLPDRESVQKLCDIVYHPGLATAPVAIALFTDSKTQVMDVNFELQDYSASCQNILLAATALGYSSLWLDYPFFNEGNQKSACALMKVPDNFHLHVVVPIGIPDGEGSRREKRPISERFHYFNG